MHAPLNTTDKQLACADFIRALEECHAKGFVKLTGGCNQVKKDLSMCLRKERIDRTTRNRDNAKLRTAKKKEVWEALDKEKELDMPLTTQVQAQTQAQPQGAGTSSTTGNGSFGSVDQAGSADQGPRI